MNNILKKVNLQIPQILSSAKNIAVVGISDKPARDSYLVASYLKEAGYKIFPVNPKLESILGMQCYENLQEIQDPIDIVDIFRRSEFVIPIVEDALRIKARTIWMQLGVINEEAAQLALRSGLNVIMNRCIKIEHSIYT